ncbi:MULTISPECIES: hypothetical protein [Paenibacillus]|uniref:DUF2759 family protein n=1 Tax=Paenibacillus polygoni TaxID=3050112 RepID=A0ABY8X3M8_9BACL|nr:MULTISPECIES: hypothetical protein [Paenibacillus]WIV18863.1 hypothetical protein QPK24_21465 [Paenibacillus polygoni]
MLLAEAASATTKFNGFDIFVILFTIIISIGLVRLVKAPKKNLFAIGFTIVSLLVFLITDYAMIKNWLS